jgi:hypothetical protein
MVKCIVLGSESQTKTNHIHISGDFGVRIIANRYEDFKEIKLVYERGEGRAYDIMVSEMKDGKIYMFYGFWNDGTFPSPNVICVNLCAPKAAKKRKQVSLLKMFDPKDGSVSDYKFSDRKVISLTKTGAKLNKMEFIIVEWHGGAKDVALGYWNDGYYENYKEI